MVKFSPFSDTAGLFKYKPEWMHSLYNLEDSIDKYRVEYTENQLSSVWIPFSGGSGRTETQCHEVAHMIDLALRGQHSRLLIENYGMPFDAVPKNAFNAVKRELAVVAIQWHIFLSCGFDPDTTRNDIKKVINGVTDLMMTECDFREKNFTFEEYNMRMMKYCAQRFRKLTMEQIETAYQSILQFFDEKCLKTCRRPV